MMRKLLLTGLTMALCFASDIGAANEQTEIKSAGSQIQIDTYAVPEFIRSTKFTDSAQLIAYLQDPKVKKEVASLAQTMFSNIADIDALPPRYKMALWSILGQSSSLLNYIEASDKPMEHFHYLVRTKAKALDSTEPKVQQVLNQLLPSISDEALYQASNSMLWQLDLGRDYLMYLINNAKQQNQLNQDRLLTLIFNFEYYWVYADLQPLAKQKVKEETYRRFDIQTDVVIKTPDGVELSAVVVTKKGEKKKRPTAMVFTIYANEGYHVSNAVHAASHGYNAVFANSRGKRMSNNAITPWRYDGEDATRVIDWITKQDWSDQRVVMYGGSYNGFTTWAATKHRHPGLKAIAAYAAASPITGLPVQNNIFLTPNYEWYFFVTNNKTMDDSVYSEHQRWSELKTNLFKSGRAFNDIDAIDGEPNPWFQELLQHPDYDEYYQAMAPWQEEYSKIDIPVLSVTGYFDPGQVSALDFVKRHYQYKPDANHTLLIGPYSHNGAQGRADFAFSNVKIDPVALQKDTEELTFEWFNHVLYGTKKPKLLQGKVNYQLMGSNQWVHHDSYQALNQEGIAYHLNVVGEQGHLVTELPKPASKVTQVVDLADRETQHNLSPWPMVQRELKAETGVVFRSEPFNETMQYAGEPTGYFDISINKKDVDIGFTLYQQKANGELHVLSHYLGRASYANDMSQRQLLTPHKKTRVPVINGQMMAQVIDKGSRIILVLDVNKNQNAQVNMGTGKDVSVETIADGKEKLTITWHSSSALHLPIKPMI